MANVTYTFKPKLTTQSVFWHDPLIWIGGVVPDSPDADVVIPTGTPLPTGGGRSDIAISSGEAFAIASLDMFQERLMLDGELTVEGTATLHESATIAGSGQFGWATGTLTAGSLVNGGSILLADGTLNLGSLLNDGGGIRATGVISVSGLLTNDSSIAGQGIDGRDLTLTASSLVNNGGLGPLAGNMTVMASSLVNNGGLVARDGDLSVTVSAGGFANLSDAILAGGSYGAHDGTLWLDVGGLIETGASYISLSALLDEELSGGDGEGREVAIGGATLGMQIGLVLEALYKLDPDPDDR